MCAKSSAIEPASNHHDEPSSSLIRWPVRLLIPVAFVMLLLQGLSEVVKRVACLRGLLPWSVLDTKVAHGAVPDQDEVAYELKAEAR